MGRNNMGWCSDVIAAQDVNGVREIEDMDKAAESKNWVAVKGTRATVCCYVGTSKSSTETITSQ